jgi:Putative MetA-pathway of phenol degradation
MVGTKWGLAAMLACAAIAGAARADPPPPDKSGFTLFNPTPDADLRPLCTDRPTKSTGPCTVDAGHFQLESDVFNWTYDTTGGADTTTWLVPNPTLKLGLTNTLDIELNIAPYVSITAKDRATGKTTRASGVGDFFVHAKLSLIGDDGGDLAIALDPYVKFPTAAPNVGDGAVEEGLIVPVQFNLPGGWSLSVDPEADGLKNAIGDGQHLNIQTPLSFGHSLSKTVTGFVEVWADENFDPTGDVTQASFDVGAAWIPQRRPNFQLDGGVNLGLNNQTPGVQAYVGVSQRF